MEVASIDTTYLFVAVLILLLIYGALRSDQKQHGKKIRIKTKQKIYAVQYDVCEIYLVGVHGDLIKLYTRADCSRLRAHIAAARDAFADYTGRGLDATDDDLRRYGIAPHTIRDDDLAYEFAALLTEIDAVVGMLRGAHCPDKILSMVELGDLIDRLHANSVGTNALTYAERHDFSFENKADVSEVASPASEIKHMAASHLVEDSVNDRVAPLRSLMPPQQKNRSNTIVSHVFDRSAGNMLITRAMPPCVPICDIDAIRAEKRYDRLATCGPVAE